MLNTKKQLKVNFVDSLEVYFIAKLKLYNIYLAKKHQLAYKLHVCNRIYALAIPKDAYGIYLYLYLKRFCINNIKVLTIHFINY